jgi:GrpB-like predicted nucleotidyltransferase (UPF0157 family)
MTNRVLEVVPYDPNWPQLFEQEAKLIQHALGDNCIAIHHIGSIAIPGLSAKPMVAALTDREWEVVRHLRQKYFFDRVPID